MYPTIDDIPSNDKRHSEEPDKVNSFKYCDSFCYVQTFIKILKKLESHSNLRVNLKSIKCNYFVLFAESFQCVAFLPHQIKELCNAVQESFRNDGMVINLKQNLKKPKKLNWIIVGDLHGRYNELWKITKSVTKHIDSKMDVGYENKFLFLGDYGIVPSFMKNLL